MKWFLYTKIPTCFGRSRGHLQGLHTKYNKLKDDTFIEVTEQIKNIILQLYNNSLKYVRYLSCKVNKFIHVKQQKIFSSIFI